jgi:hypothetical protein
MKVIKEDVLIGEAYNKVVREDTPSISHFSSNPGPDSVIGNKLASHYGEKTSKLHPDIKKRHTEQDELETTQDDLKKMTLKEVINELVHIRQHDFTKLVNKDFLDYLANKLRDIDIAPHDVQAAANSYDPDMQEKYLIKALNDLVKIYKGEENEETAHVVKYKGYTYKPKHEMIGDHKHVHHHVITPQGKHRTIKTKAKQFLSNKEFCQWLDQHLGGDQDARFNHSIQ